MSGAVPRGTGPALLGLSAALLAGLLAQPALAAGIPVKSTAETRATVVAPLSVIKTQDMDFGKIVPSPAGGTVTVDPISSACTVTGTIREIATCRYAQFVGRGTRNMNARISITGVVNLTGPGQAMVLDNLLLGLNNTLDLTGNTNSNGRGVGLTQGNGNAVRYKIITNSGIYFMNVGGRLRVNANQAPGAYRGSFSISVQYQ